MPNVARPALVLLLILAPFARAEAQERATPAQLAAAREYVRRGWRTLARSERDLLSAATDPKFQSTLSAQQRVPPRQLRWPVCIARGEELGAVRRRLRARLTAEDFARVELRRLPERAGGLRTSTARTGSQWDAPYGWAPMQLIAAEGLRAYGFHAEADNVSVNFLSLVLKEFVEHNTIVEKYDVERRTSSLGAGLRFGYASNEIGFGWTNAAFTELYAQLPPAERPKVLELGGVGHFETVQGR